MAAWQRGPYFILNVASTEFEIVYNNVLCISVMSNTLLPYHTMSSLMPSVMTIRMPGCYPNRIPRLTPSHILHLAMCSLYFRLAIPEVRGSNQINQINQMPGTSSDWLLTARVSYRLLGQGSTDMPQCNGHADTLCSPAGPGIGVFMPPVLLAASSGRASHFRSTPRGDWY